jgi:hypothetical protein
MEKSSKETHQDADRSRHPSEQPSSRSEETLSPLVSPATRAHAGAHISVSGLSEQRNISPVVVEDEKEKQYQSKSQSQPQKQSSSPPMSDTKAARSSDLDEDARFVCNICLDPGRPPTLRYMHVHTHYTHKSFFLFVLQSKMLL